MSWTQAGEGRYKRGPEHHGGVGDAYLLRTEHGYAEAHSSEDGRTTVHLYVPVDDPRAATHARWLARHFRGKTPDTGSPLDGHMCLQSVQVDELYGESDDKIWPVLAGLADALRRS